MKLDFRDSFGEQITTLKAAQLYFRKGSVFVVAKKSKIREYSIDSIIRTQSGYQLLCTENLYNGQQTELMLIKV